jgi:hypothetical protein
VCSEGLYAFLGLSVFWIDSLLAGWLYKFTLTHKIETPFYEFKYSLKFSVEKLDVIYLIFSFRKTENINSKTKSWG